MFKEVFTTKEVADMLKISISELRKLMAKKEISYFEVGEKSSKKKAKRFRLSDVDDYISRNYCTKTDRIEVQL